MFVGTNPWLWEQQKIYGCRNKKTMVVGTKYMVLGTKKPNVVETKLFSSEKIYDWGKKTKDVGTNLL
jgi:hypothetical protein